MDTTPPSQEDIRRQAGARLQLLRQKTHLSRDQLAKLTGVGKNQIGKIEGGEPVRDVDLRYAIARLATVLHVYPDYLLVEFYGKWQFQTTHELLAHQQQMLAATQEPEPLKNAEAVRSRWLYYVAQFQTSFSATNYIPMDKIFKEKYANDGREIQARKKKENPNLPICKLFIADTPDEFKKYEPEMYLQAQAGLAVKWRRYGKIVGDTGLKEIWDRNQLDAIDFQIFDGSLVLCWSLREGTREVLGGKVLRCDERRRAHQEFFDPLWTSATDYDDEKRGAQFDTE